MRQLFKRLFLEGPAVSTFAATLSFYTMLSSVPLLFVIFSLLSVFGGYERYVGALKEFVLQNILPASYENATSYIQLFEQFLANSASLGIVGALFTVYAAFIFLHSYEEILGALFSNPKRPLKLVVPRFMVLLLLAPFFLFGLFMFTGTVQNILSDYIYLPRELFAVFHFLAIWFTFFAVFDFSYYKKSSSSNLLLSSALTAIFWVAAKGLFVYYVKYSVTYAVIYGSFSSLFFFFVWIYYSWQIFLYGLKFLDILEN